MPTQLLLAMAQIRGEDPILRASRARSPGRPQTRRPARHNAQKRLTVTHRPWLGFPARRRDPLCTRFHRGCLAFPSGAAAPHCHTSSQEKRSAAWPHAADQLPPHTDPCGPLTFQHPLQVLLGRQQGLAPYPRRLRFAWDDFTARMASSSAETKFHKKPARIPLHGQHSSRVDTLLWSVDNGSRRLHRPHLRVAEAYSHFAMKQPTKRFRLAMGANHRSAEFSASAAA